MLIKDELWRQKFFNYYFNNNLEKRKKGLELLHAKRPKVFCKYMSPEHAENFVTTHKLWFSSMRKFNDPADGHWYFFNELENSTAQQKNAIQYFKECSGLTGTIYESDDYIPPTITDIFLVCSLTTNPLDKEMWEKYTNQSTGACFEFDILSCPSYYIPLFYNKQYPVIYFDEKVDLTNLIYDCYSDGWYDQISGIGFQERFFLLSILLKNSKYSNENEWRAIWYRPLHVDPDGGLFEQILSPSNIYLGSKIDRELKTIILENEKYANIYQVHENDGELIKELIQPRQTRSGVVI